MVATIGVSSHHVWKCCIFRVSFVEVCLLVASMSAFLCVQQYFVGDGGALPSPLLQPAPQLQTLPHPCPKCLLVLFWIWLWRDCTWEINVFISVYMVVLAWVKFSIFLAWWSIFTSVSYSFILVYLKTHRNLFCVHLWWSQHQDKKWQIFSSTPTFTVPQNYTFV